MREKEVESYLRNEVKKMGGIAYKFTSPGNAGVPDRLVCFPEGQIYFAELKAPGKKITTLQEMQIKRLRELGFIVAVLDSKEKVDNFLEMIKRG